MLGGVRNILGNLNVSPSRVERQGWVSAMVGAQTLHECHALDTCRPLRQFPEQVAVNDVGKVGAIFGLAMGRFGPWFQKQSCSPPNDLQNSLRAPVH